MAQSAEHIAADKDHKPVWEGDEIYNCSICGLAVMSDGRNHGFDSDYDTQEATMYKTQSEASFTVDTTVTFGLDEANEPTSVTVVGPVLFGNGVLSRSMAREFAQAALDTHYGNDDHGYAPQLSPILNEESPEPEGTMTFEIRKTHALIMKQARGEK